MIPISRHCLCAGLTSSHDRHDVGVQSRNLRDIIRRFVMILSLVRISDTIRPWHRRGVSAAQRRLGVVYRTSRSVLDSRTRSFRQICAYSGMCRTEDTVPRWSTEQYDWYFSALSLVCPHTLVGHPHNRFLRCKLGVWPPVRTHASTVTLLDSPT